MASNKKPGTITVDLPEMGEVLDYILVARVMTGDELVIFTRTSDNLTPYDRVGMLEFAKFYPIESGTPEDE